MPIFFWDEERKRKKKEAEQRAAAASIADPKTFLDRVPERDAAGVELPPWKRFIMARQLSDQAVKEEQRIRRIAEEDAMLQSMPKWKRAIVERNRAEMKALQEQDDEDPYATLHPPDRRRQRAPPPPTYDEDGLPMTAQQIRSRLTRQTHDTDYDADDSDTSAFMTDTETRSRSDVTKRRNRSLSGEPDQTWYDNRRRRNTFAAGENVPPWDNVPVAREISSLKELADAGDAGTSSDTTGSDYVNSKMLKRAQRLRETDDVSEQESDYVNMDVIERSARDLWRANDHDYENDGVVEHEYENVKKAPNGLHGYENLPTLHGGGQSSGASSVKSGDTNGAATPSTVTQQKPSNANKPADGVTKILIKRQAPIPNQPYKNSEC